MKNGWDNTKDKASKNNTIVKYGKGLYHGRVFFYEKIFGGDLNLKKRSVIIKNMKKLTTLLSKKFNELHLLVQQAESMDSLEIVSGGIEHLQDLLNKRTNQVKAFVSREERNTL